VKEGGAKQRGGTAGMVWGEGGVGKGFQEDLFEWECAKSVLKKKKKFSLGGGWVV